MGKGRVVSCFFGLSGLIRQIGLEDWKILFENCLSYLADGKGEAEARELPEGVFFYPYRTPEGYLVHLVNGIGERPLRSCQPCHGLCFGLRVGQRDVESVDCVLEDIKVQWRRDGEMLAITLECLHVWQLIRIKWQEAMEEWAGGHRRDIEWYRITCGISMPVWMLTGMWNIWRNLEPMSVWWAAEASRRFIPQGWSARRPALIWGMISLESFWQGVMKTRSVWSRGLISVRHTASFWTRIRNGSAGRPWAIPCCFTTRRRPAWTVPINRSSPWKSWKRWSRSIRWTESFLICSAIRPMITADATWESASVRAANGVSLNTAVWSFPQGRKRQIRPFGDIRNLKEIPQPGCLIRSIGRWSSGIPRQRYARTVTKVWILWETSPTQRWTDRSPSGWWRARTMSPV